MNVIHRQVVWGMLVAFVVFILVTSSFLIAFPLNGWKELWDRDLMDVPFILFVPSVSLAAGLIFGFSSGVYWRKRFHSIDRILHEVEEGRSIDSLEINSIGDMKTILNRINKIQNQMQEQVKLSQRLANQKAEDQENRIQEIISQERNRLARELHDSVSQQLFGASMLMSAINETRSSADERETKQLKLVESMIHQSQLEMRALLLHLRPVALKGKSLQEGMEELLIELSQKVTMKIDWKVEEFCLDKGIEDHLFRILQESVSNTLRHSKASNLEVLLIQRDDFIILRVVDDGIGFDVEGSRAGSYGMQNMYERAVEIGGAFKIVSVKGKGTRLEVKVPIMKKEGVGND
ncbi:sensor histidine kinase [Bacillus dakarensis]|uniref:sensor histidine kinase n=1 Tax=Robertmurraya dakarensis TaxID=1926278 RepID=UPI000982624F|nr:sensor histidine kinase [Bacillus dakarensis]